MEDDSSIINKNLTHSLEDKMSIDTDERVFIENISWDTDSDEEDLYQDEDVHDVFSKKYKDGQIHMDTQDMINE